MCLILLIVDTLSTKIGTVMRFDHRRALLSNSSKLPRRLTSFRTSHCCNYLQTAYDEATISYALLMS